MAVKRQVIVGVASLAALYVGVSNALGLGEMRLDSSLNQPLSATIQLQDAQGLSASDIIVSLAEPDAFDRAGIDRPFFLTDLRFVPVVENNQLLIRVESTRPVREPYLNFLVELRRPGGRRLREYTVLLDPPLYEPQTGLVSTPAAALTPARPVARPSSTTAPARTSQSGSEPATTALREVPTLEPQSDAARYTTVAGDSLWDIAVNQRPDRSVPIRVSMAAIHALNPDAFIGGDIDKLRQGHTLVMPTREQLVTAGAPQALLAEAAGDAAEQPEARPPAAPAVVPEPAAVTARPEEDVADLVEPEPIIDAEPAADPVADAGVSEPMAEAPDVADAAPLVDPESAEVRLRIEETTLEAVDADSAELLGRLNALESRFNVLLSELDARDAQIASLQAELEVLRAAKAAEEELDGELAGTAGAGSLGGGDTGSGPSAAGGSDDPAAGSIAANVLPGEEPQAAASSSSWLSWLTLPLVFIAFLLGWLLSRRRHQEEESIAPEPVTQHDSPTGFSSNISTVPAMVARPVAQPAAKPAVDPLDGVELYVTYGRFAEARTMLDKAIDEEPERLDLRYKQLRVLAELGDGPAFAEQEEEITELGGDVERIDQIKARFPLLFNDNGDYVEQVDSLEPLLGEEDQIDSEFNSGIEEEHDESNTSQLNLNDFTLDPDWDLIDGLSPEPMRKNGAREPLHDVDKTISEEEFESSLHKLPQVEELDHDQQEHFSSAESEEDKSSNKK